MKSIRNYFLVAILSIASVFAQAETMSKFIKGLENQDQLTEWVMNNAEDKLTEREARSIVLKVYEASLSTQYQLDPRTMLAVMRTESGFRKNAKSGYGAVGYLQIVPRYHQDKIMGRNPYDPDINIRVGAKIMSDCMIKHHGNVFRATNCYSGGGSHKYYKKVSAYKHKLDTYIATTRTTMPVVDPLGDLIRRKEKFS